MAKRAAKEPVQRFEAKLEALAGTANGGLGWTIVRLPFVPGDVWKTMVRLRVKGEVNGYAFRTSLFPSVGGGYFLLVNKAMQQGAGVRLGKVAGFGLEPDLEARPAELPDELGALLEEEPELRGYYDALSEYTRREIGKWVIDVKSDEARMRRAEQMAERLLVTMEAEKELPPVVARAFRKRPKAKAGWAKMTPTQRRMELFACFYYKTPEALERRVGKLCDVAEKKA
jgi:uncharacterized protein YdeI (YjbR/CyaY-like superfamily)